MDILKVMCKQYQNKRGIFSKGRKIKAQFY